jgi:hypothetical protein
MDEPQVGLTVLGRCGLPPVRLGGGEQSLVGMGEPSPQGAAQGEGSPRRASATEELTKS